MTRRHYVPAYTPKGARVHIIWDRAGNRRTLCGQLADLRASWLALNQVDCARCQAQHARQLDAERTPGDPSFNLE